MLMSLINLGFLFSIVVSIQHLHRRFGNHLPQRYQIPILEKKGIKKEIIIIIIIIILKKGVGGGGWRFSLTAHAVAVSGFGQYC
jgi:hypothetical protein